MGRRFGAQTDKALMSDWYTVQIAEHNYAAGTQRCMLPRLAGCDYLSSIVKLRDINWTAKELKPITGFMAQIKCDALGRMTDHQQN